MSPFWIWAIALAGYAVYWLTDFRRQANKLPRLLAKAKALGCPTTEHEYGTFMAVPQEDNAAPVYQELIGAYERLQESQPNALHIVGSLTFETRGNDNRLRAACDQLSELTTILGQAVGFPSFRVNRLDQFASGIDRYALPIRVAAKVLAFDALIAADIGDHERAIGGLRAFRRVVDHSHFEPTILSWIVYTSQAARWLSVMGEYAKVVAGDETLLQWVHEALDSAPALHKMLVSLKGEVAIELAQTNMAPEEIDDCFDGNPPFPLSTKYFRARLANQAYASDSLQVLLRAIEKWPEDETDWRRMGKLLQPVYSGGNWLVVPSQVWRRFHVNPASSVTSLETRKRLTNIGVGILRHQAKYGALPVNLGPWQDLAVDPVNGAAFVYERANGHFHLKCGFLNF